MKVTTVPRPQQAKNQRRVSCPEDRLRTGELPRYYYYYDYYYRGINRLLQLLLRPWHKPTTTTTTTAGVERISTFRTRKIREVSFPEIIILYIEYPPLDPYMTYIIVSSIVPQYQDNRTFSAPAPSNCATIITHLSLQ